MARLFGTDGIRAVANDGLDSPLAYRVGQAAALILTRETNHKPVICIGKDTRISSDMLEAALVAGVTSAGADAVLLGVLPTPGVAHATVKSADAGIVISASHNSFEYNGIKIFNSEGFKLRDDLEDEMEALIKSDMLLQTGAGLGRVRYDETAAWQYVGYLRGCVTADLRRMRIAVDCANGAASRTAPVLFGGYNPAALEIIHNNPDGVNINDGCGSTHLESLQSLVTVGGFDIGIAFDGDADRCLVVDEKGGVVDGDRIMALCALAERDKGRLTHDTIVATVMSNLGLRVWGRENGMNILAAPVGDRYVLEEMQKGGYLLGGEQSGHVIFLRHATTGDGQLTALKFLSLAAKSGQTVSQLAAEVPQYPQVLMNVRVTPEVKARYASDPTVCKAIAAAEARLGSEGRVLVRASGTEGLVRVMLEGKDKGEIESLCRTIVQNIENL